MMTRKANVTQAEIADMTYETADLKAMVTLLTGTGASMSMHIHSMAADLAIIFPNITTNNNTRKSQTNNTTTVTDNNNLQTSFSQYLNHNDVNYDYFLEFVRLRYIDAALLFLSHLTRI